MSIRSKREVVKTMKTRTRMLYGKPREVWEFYLGTDLSGSKLRVTRSSKKAAMEYIDDFYRKYKECGESMVVLRPAQVHDAMTAIDILSQSGSTLSLTEVAKLVVTTFGKTSPVSDKTIGAAYEEYFSNIPEAQKFHKKAVAMRVGKWVLSFGGDRLISDVTAREIAVRLEKVGRKSDKSFNNHLSYIKSFLGWCAKKERMYLVNNPASDMELRSIAYKEPKYMPASDVEKMIRIFEADGDRKSLAVIVLSFFCGIRTEEIGRLMEDPSQVNLEDETIRISMPKGWTRGIAPRAFHIPPVALAWMKAYNLKSVFGSFNVQNRRQWFGIKTRKAGIEFPPNAGRHTFITMHVAAYGEPTKTEAMAGTSKEMRASHYMGLASKRDGEKFFSIFPKEKASLLTGKKGPYQQGR